MFYSKCTKQHQLTYMVRNDGDCVQQFSCGKDKIGFGSTKKS